MKPSPALIAAFALVTVISTGCATHYMEAAQQEQRAADSLHSVGTTEAAQAAQRRADDNRETARCKEFLDCSLDVLGQLLLGLIGGGSAGKN